MPTEAEYNRISGNQMSIADLKRLMVEYDDRYMTNFWDTWVDRKERIEKALYDEYNNDPHNKPYPKKYLVYQAAAHEVAAEMKKLDAEREEYLEEVRLSRATGGDDALSGLTKADCAWVIQNMENPKVTAEVAPNLAAYGLLVRARDDSGLYKWALDRVTPKTFVDESNKIDATTFDLTGVADQIREGFAEVWCEVEDTLGKRLPDILRRSQAMA